MPLMQLGYVYRETERFTEALEAFTTITGIYPDNAKAYHELGVCHTKTRHVFKSHQGV